VLNMVRAQGFSKSLFRNLDFTPRICTRKISNHPNMILRATRLSVARRPIRYQATKRVLSSSAPQSPPSPTQPVVPLQPITTTPASTSPQSPHQHRDKIVAYRTEGGPKRYDDTLWLYTTIGSLAAMPFIVYYYYESRKKHMNELRYKKLGEAQERYRARGGG